MVEIFPQAQALVNESIIGLRETHGSGDKPFDMEVQYVKFIFIITLHWSVFSTMEGPNVQSSPRQLHYII